MKSYKAVKHYKAVKQGMPVLNTIQTYTYAHACIFYVLACACQGALNGAIRSKPLCRTHGANAK